MSVILHTKLWHKRTLTVLASCLLVFAVLDLCLPVHTELEYAPVIVDSDGTVMHCFLTGDEQWRMYTRLEEITPELKKAIVFKEDKYFRYHFGINPVAVVRAALYNLLKGRRVSGASTITMQVARMLQPKKRTWLNKITEAFRALQLELHFSKDEILQLYLNLVPYGSNIQGVKAAALLYFQKSPDQLSLAEITALSIIPNRPNALQIGRNNDQIIFERNKWLLRFEADHLFAAKTIKDALQEPLLASRHEAPSAIPHLAYRLRRQFPQLHEIKTTINPRWQQTAEELLSNHVRTLQHYNIFNAAAIVVDNSTRNVLCYLGSSDPYDRQHHGAVDGVQARRSPGSTLKPMLYALCMDKGWITPQSVIADVPVNFGGYAPENFDLGFRGNVTAEKALQQSLNIPAVKMLQLAGTQTFTHLLAQAGCRSVWQQRKELGLSMILGGCTVRLSELACLYSTLANEGRYLPLNTRALPGPSSVQPVSVLSPEASYLTSRIIAGLYRPDIPNLTDKSQDLPRICWKTGTSYGRKDAWSVGYNKRYTIAVWIGNFDGKGVPEINGAGVATPLLFHLFRALDRRAGEEWLKAPAGIATRFVCPQSGKLANDFCTSSVLDEYITGVSSQEVCDHKREVWTSADGKMAYCTSCLPPTGYATRLYDNVSAELAAFYDSHHVSYEKVPAHNPACNRSFEGFPPTINSLTDGMTYIIADRGKQKLMLHCTVANDVKKVYWYVNDQFYVGAAASEKIFFSPQAPEIKISCADDKGRNANIFIRVKFI